MTQGGKMHEQDNAVLRSLVSVAWADGRVSPEETAVIDALIQAFAATALEAREIWAYAAEPRTLADIPLSELSSEDRRLLVQHAVLLTHIDGEPSPEAKRMVNQLCDRLRIPKDEASGLVACAQARVERFVHLL
jgi:tellurite resistance protein